MTIPSAAAAHTATSTGMPHDRERDQADRGVGGGDEDEDHRMVERCMMRRARSLRARRWYAADVPKPSSTPAT